MPKITESELLRLIREIEKERSGNSKREKGRVVKVGDGVVKISGLASVGYNDIVSIGGQGGTTKALVLDLRIDEIGAVVLGNFEDIKEGDEVEFNGENLAIRVDDNILGETVDILGRRTGDGKIVCPKGTVMPLERVAAGVKERKDVSRPLYTGLLAIDATIPIGKGQRELIIGDKKTGKTSIAVDTIIKQKGEDVICIYVAVGQKSSKIAQIRSDLRETGVLGQTVLVVAEAAKPAVWQYLAPYAGTAIGEYFAKKGKDVLIVFDDLSKHANAYREIALLLKRPAGREAYPGDIFYLHSRLLERALQYSDEMGGGSITALPVIETQAGDLSAYIPTNVISITDGQIFLDSDMFNGGQRPAINVGASVSRVGSNAQTKPMKQVAGPLKLDLAQYRELQAFAQFGSDLDEVTVRKLKKGEMISSLLNQKEREPLAVDEEITSLFAAVNELIPTGGEEVVKWRQSWLRYWKINGQKVGERILGGEKIEGELEEKLKKVINNFNNTYS